MSIEAFVTAWLGRDPDVQQLAGGRIFPAKIPQGAALPAVTYQKVSQTTFKTLSGLAGLATARMQIDCWAQSYTDAKALATAIRGDIATPKLDGYRGILAGTRVQACFCENEIDLIEKPIHGDEAGIEHMALDFLITYEDLDLTIFDDEEPYKELE